MVKKTTKKTSPKKATNSGIVSPAEMAEYVQLIKDIGTNKKEGAFIILEVEDRYNNGYGLSSNIKSYGLDSMQILKAVVKGLRLRMI